MAITDTLINLGLPLLGGVLGSQNGAREAGTTTVTQTPWSPVQPYLVGGAGTTPGIADQAATLYNQQRSGMPDYLSQAYANYLNTANQNMSGPAASALSQNITNVLSGSNAPNITPVGPARVSNANAGRISLSNQLQSMGQLDPTNAYGQLLSGNVNTSALDPVVENAASRMFRNFETQLLPSINQNAVASGNYGSSRHGIAQGLASEGLFNSLGDMYANMYNNAFNVSQGQMANAAGQLGNLAGNLATNQAGLDTQVNVANASAANNMNQFNANLGLQNNNQAMANYQTQLAGLNTAANALNQMNASQANLGLGAINAANSANNYNWQQLGNYQSAIQPLAGLGGQSSQPYYTNPVAGAIGGATLGTQAANYLTRP